MSLYPPPARPPVAAAASCHRRRPSVRPHALAPPSRAAPAGTAQVLDRSERLKEEEASIRAIAADRLDWLVASADLLRKLLRVKVEDGNDLQMAMSTVEQVHRFYSRMQQYAEQSGEEPFSLYQRLVTF